MHVHTERTSTAIVPVAASPIVVCCCFALSGPIVHPPSEDSGQTGLHHLRSAVRLQRVAMHWAFSNCFTDTITRMLSFSTLR